MLWVENANSESKLFALAVGACIALYQIKISVGKEMNIRLGCIASDREASCLRLKIEQHALFSQYYLLDGV
jgi:hypothetical protein